MKEVSVCHKHVLFDSPDDESDRWLISFGSVLPFVSLPIVIKGPVGLNLRNFNVKNIQIQILLDQECYNTLKVFPYYYIQQFHPLRLHGDRNSRTLLCPKVQACYT